MFTEVLSTGMERRAGPQGVKHLSRHEECLCEFERVHEAVVTFPQREAPEQTYINMCQGKKGRLRTSPLGW